MNQSRILLLEDCDGDRESITGELASLGFTSLCCVSTREGFVQALASFDPALVIADYHLSSFKIHEALRLVRDKDVNLPFIVVTGAGDESAVSDLLRKGADDYLLKDRLGRLGTAMRHALRLRELRDQLADRETLLRRIFDTEPECVKLLDEEGRLLELNRAGLEMLEVSSFDEVRHQPVYGFIVSEHRDQFREGVRRVFTGESLRAQFQIMGTKGTMRWMETNAVPLRDPSDRITALLAITRDITKSKALEEQFRQAQKLEAVGRLAGGVAHDFNNILTIISGYATMTLALPDIDETVRSNIVGIQNGVHRAASLTRQLLAFSRKQLFQPRVLDINGLITTLSSLVTRVIGEDIRLTLQLDPQAGYIKADPNQIEQVVMNLAVNARDAMPRGGSMAIETARAELSSPIEQHGLRCEPGQYARLSIKDTGAGMSDEVLSHVFEPFYTTKDPGKGTGLGLSTVYGIVQQSLGAITVTSVPGIGTKVDVYFPVSMDPMQTASTTESRSARGNEKILVVEDDPELRKLVRDMLKSFGYIVTVAESGSAALRTLEFDREIDLILTDIVMPGMSGLELGRQVSSRALATEVVYMTGYTEDFIANQGRSGIPEGFHTIEKPFTPDNLGSLIRRVLDAVKK